MASSIASLMAVPREPGWLGSAVMMFLPALVDIDGEPSTVAPNVRIMMER